MSDSVEKRLAEQLRLQERADRAAWPLWVPPIFVLGFLVALVGVYEAAIAIRFSRGVSFMDAVFACFALFFGAMVFQLVMPARMRPRIVPYFTRALEPHGGAGAEAFARGRALYRAILDLDRRAESLGVTPLSGFGFADDYYAQTVVWHPAEDGLRTADALHVAMRDEPVATPELFSDLEALAAALRVARERGVDFALVLRPYARDSVQGVATRQARAGSFW